MPATPPNRHLQWVEIKDFTPGLWEVGDWLVPAGAAQTLTDAYPQPGGGLRAFFAPSTLITTGIGANEKIIGFFGYATSHRTLSTYAVDYYCVTIKQSDGSGVIYRYDTTDAGESDWTAMQTLATGIGKQANFTAYVKSDGTKRILVSIGGGADTGIWGADQADDTATQTWAKLTGSSGLGPITVHQNRLVEGQGSKVYYTDVGAEDLSFGYVDVEPQRVLSDIKAFIPSAPGDLLIGKEGAAWSAIQGELTDPVVRTMSEAHYLGHRDQTLADTGKGIAFIEPYSGIWLTVDGSSFQQIDTQLYPPTEAGDSNVAVTMGDLAFHKRWLFAPQGFVWDAETNAWFKVSDYSNVWVQFAERFNDRVYSITGGYTPTIYSLNVNEDSGTRSTDYTWKSAPLRSADGRRIEVREVQVYARSYDAASTIAVTVNGVTRTSAALAVGKHMVPFLFRTSAEVVDVQVVAASNTSSEAPSVEVVRIGHRGVHLGN